MGHISYDVIPSNRLKQQSGHNHDGGNDVSLGSLS